MPGHKCSVCGHGLQYKSLYCIDCYRKYQKACPGCRQVSGQLMPKYRRHVGNGKVCTHCGVAHDDSRQLVCPTCSNERVVFDPPKGASSPWPTPSARDWKGCESNQHEKNARPLNEVALLAGWPTVTASLADKNVRSEEGAIKEAMRSHGPDLGAVAALVDLTGWMSPKATDTESARDWKGCESNQHDKNARPLNEVALLAGWPTTQERDADGRGVTADRADGTRMNLDDYAQLVGLAGWPSPNALEFGHTDLEGMEARRHKYQEKYGNNGFGLTLGQATAMWLVGWPSPTALSFAESHRPGNNQSMNRTLELLAGWKTPDASEKVRSEEFRQGREPNALEASGIVSPSPTAPTAGRGALNPSHSRWLMGFHEIWDRCSPGWPSWELMRRLLAAWRERLPGTA